MTNLIDLTLSELLKKIKSKEISSKEITTAYIERSKKSKKLNKNRKFIKKCIFFCTVGVNVTENGV